MSCLLAASWSDGLFTLDERGLRQEIAGEMVRGLTSDGFGNVFAIVGGRSLKQRAANGSWTTLATASDELSCCVAVGRSIFVGTESAQVLRFCVGGPLEPLPGFERIEGRERWYAGSAIIEGRRVGPPLGIRSIAATCDGEVLIANVHVGGIPRSLDGGATWSPSIDIDADVHQVCAHPTRPGVVIAAAAAGLAVSSDGAATWTVERSGLHASYCSAVAFSGADLLVAASEHHFAARGALYRRGIDGPGPLRQIGAGLPAWMTGIVDTDCIAARGPRVAAVDRAGDIYVSADHAQHWSLADGRVPNPSGLLIVD